MDPIKEVDLESTAAKPARLSSKSQEAKQNERKAKKKEKNESKLSIPRVVSAPQLPPQSTEERPLSSPRQRPPVLNQSAPGFFTSSDVQIDDYSDTELFKNYVAYCELLISRLTNSADQFIWTAEKTQRFSNALISANIQTTLKHVGELIGLDYYPEEIKNARAHETMVRQTVTALANVVCDYLFDQIQSIFCAPIELVLGLITNPSLFSFPMALNGHCTLETLLPLSVERRLEVIVNILSDASSQWKFFLKRLYSYYMATTKAAGAFDEFILSTGGDLRDSAIGLESIRRRGAYFRPEKWNNISKLPLEHPAVSYLLDLITATQNLMKEQEDLFFPDLFPFELVSHEDVSGLLNRIHEAFDSPVNIVFSTDSPRGKNQALRNLFLLADPSEPLNGRAIVATFLSDIFEMKGTLNDPTIQQNKQTILESPDLVSGLYSMIDSTNITRRLLQGIVPPLISDASVLCLEKCSGQRSRKLEVQTVTKLLADRMGFTKHEMSHIGNNSNAETVYNESRYYDPQHVLGRPILTLEAVSGAVQAPMVKRLAYSPSSTEQQKADLAQFTLQNPKIVCSSDLASRAIESLTLPAARLIGDIHQDPMFMERFTKIFDYTCVDNNTKDQENPVPESAVGELVQLLTSHKDFDSFVTLLRIREKDARTASDVLYGKGAADLTRKYKLATLFDDGGLLMNQPPLQLLQSPSLLRDTTKNKSASAEELITTASKTLSGVRDDNSRGGMLYQTLLTKTRETIVNTIMQNAVKINHSSDNGVVTFQPAKELWKEFAPRDISDDKKLTDAEKARNETEAKETETAIMRIFSRLCVLDDGKPPEITRDETIKAFEIIIERITTRSDFPVVFSFFQDKERINDNDYRDLYMWMVAEILTLIASFHVYTLLDIEALTFFATNSANRGNLHTDTNPALDAYTKWRQRAIAKPTYFAPTYKTIAECIDAYLTLIMDIANGNNALKTAMNFTPIELEEQAKIKRLLDIAIKLDRISDYRHAQWALRKVSRWGHLPHSQEGRVVIQGLAGEVGGLVFSTALMALLLSWRQETDSSSATAPPEELKLLNEATRQGHETTKGSFVKAIQERLDKLKEGEQLDVMTKLLSVVKNETESRMANVVSNPSASGAFMDSLSNLNETGLFNNPTVVEMTKVYNLTTENAFDVIDSFSVMNGYYLAAKEAASTKGLIFIHLPTDCRDAIRTMKIEASENFLIVLNRAGEILKQIVTTAFDREGNIAKFAAIQTTAKSVERLSYFVTRAVLSTWGQVASLVERLDTLTRFTKYQVHAEATNPSVVSRIGKVIVWPFSNFWRIGRHSIRIIDQAASALALSYITDIASDPLVFNVLLLSVVGGVSCLGLKKLYDLTFNVKGKDTVDIDKAGPNPQTFPERIRSSFKDLDISKIQIKADGDREITNGNFLRRLLQNNRAEKFFNSQFLLGWSEKSNIWSAAFSQGGAKKFLLSTFLSSAATCAIIAGEGYAHWGTIIAGYIAAIATTEASPDLNRILAESSLHHVTPGNQPALLNTKTASVATSFNEEIRRMTNVALGVPDIEVGVSSET